MPLRRRAHNGDPLLDIDVATPNGASNHLLIKMAKPHTDGKLAARRPETTAPSGAATTPRISGQANRYADSSG